MPEQLLRTYEIHRLPDSAADPGASVAAVPARCRDLKHMIGNTPMLAIRFRFRDQERVVYAKAEHINMTGSIKDRMAFHILKKAYQEGRIEPAIQSRKQPAATPASRSRRSAARSDTRW
jgi:hypothetical protein